MSWQRTERMWWRCLLLLALLVVTALMWTPAPALPPVSMWDKLQHLLAFVGLAALAWLAFPACRREGLLGLLLAYGLLTEVGQAFIPSRSFSWLDWLADSLGAALVLLWKRR